MCHFKGNSLDLYSSFYLESKRVDFLSMLGEKTGHPLIVSKILSYLSGPDLQNVTKVSKTWQKLCLSDRAAALKMKQFIAKRKTAKENSWGCNSMQRCNESTPKKRRPLACWNENYNFTSVKQTPKSPPVSPRLKKFNQYLKKSMNSWKTVLVTGGAGYIASHTIVELQEVGYNVVAIDNFANSVTTPDGQAPSLQRVEMITKKPVKFYKCDLLDFPALDNVFHMHDIDCVIHFAAMKAVGESMQNPLLYHKNNLVGTINLLEVMKKHACYQLVFSSSCTIYGNPEQLPITEEHKIGDVTNVYGKTKYFIEEMLKDITTADKNWNVISLRYFNPVGAHPSGLIGEDPTKPFTNLMPYMAQVAIGKLPILHVFGGDYDTIDGTGVRDYIHVMDLASGHVAALNKLKNQHLRLKAYNLGTGQGTSVLQLLKTFESVTKAPIPFVIKERREGDIVAMFANASLAYEELGWKAKYSLAQMCEDFWRWQKLNPNGYRSGTFESKTYTEKTNGVSNGSNIKSVTLSDSS